jgi:uncharacterized RmlC-like cupin family protein
MIYTKEYLHSKEWDVINCGISFDVDKLVAWYETVCEKYQDLKFDFSIGHVLSEEYKNSNGYNDALRGDISSWTIDWPTEKNIPIPPTFAANDELFPELKVDIPFKIQERYKFGYFNDICKMLGEDIFCRSRITVHNTGAEIKKHVDDGQGLRLHIPIISNNESKFLFGDNLNREYTMEAGNIYIINATIPHATINNGPSRAHIISDPSIDKMLRLLK